MMTSRNISVDLAGKTALVTGGARGIGRAVASVLARNGARVLIHYHSSGDEAREFIAEWDGSGEAPVALKADLSVAADIDAMFSEIANQTGSVDILVNNAGTIFALETLGEMSSDNWRRSQDLLLNGPMLCCRYVLPGMKEKAWGRIVNITSISARTGGGPGGIAYASAKGALSAFTRGLAKEAAVSGITVNAIAPGIIMTDIHRQFSTEQQLEDLRSRTPVGRLGEPEDIAGAVLYLVSDSASFVTGATIDVNGGLRMD